MKTLNYRLEERIFENPKTGNSLMENTKRIKYLRNYLKIAIITLVFCLLSVVLIVMKAYSYTDVADKFESFEMTYMIFRFPVLLTVILLVASLVLLRGSKEKNNPGNAGFVLASILSVPVAVFGLLLMVGNLFQLIRYLLQLIFNS